MWGRMSGGERLDALTMVRGTPEHRGFVRRLAKAAFARFGAYDLILPRLFVADGVESWIAEIDAAPVGFALYSIDLETAEGDLLAIAVEAAWQRRGVGQELLAQVERCVATAGRRAPFPAALRLTVAVDNTAARRLFEGAGFRHVPGEELYYPGGQRAITLRKVLDAPPGAAQPESQPASRSPST
jgi:GNAT superfamily N-acetyltransferase